MKRLLPWHQNLFIFSVLVSFIIGLTVVSNSAIFQQHASSISFGITVDLLLLIPLLYFFCIRKTSIPNTTVLPVLVLCVVTASIILPVENQYYLGLFKVWILPFLELAVFGYAIYNLQKGIAVFKKNNVASVDFYRALKHTCTTIFPKGIANFFVVEIAVFYYGFFRWKNTSLTQNEFSYHKNGGSVGLLFAAILLIIIETAVFHVLLLKWSIIAAFVLTCLSIYSGVQILGFLKSMLHRPIRLEGDMLYLNYGILNETKIDVKSIKSIEITSKAIDFDDATMNFSFLESHNMLITLHTENTLYGIYGIQRNYTALACYIDNKEAFKESVESVKLN